MPPRMFNVLLVEDDNLDALQIQKSFDKASMKYNLLRAENGEEAQEILKGLQLQNKPIPHFIILDLNMPRMGGLEFLKWLRTEEAFMATSVFILSSSTDQKEMLGAYQLNIAGYIVKPLEQEPLHHSIEKLKNFLEVCEFPS